MRSLQESSYPALGYSEDGYIRMSFQHLCALPFRQRRLLDDADLCDELRERGVPALRAGWCDWLDACAAARVSIGWGWFAIATSAPRLLAPGGFSSNVMLVTRDGRDLGFLHTGELLAAWLSAQCWQRASLHTHRESDAPSHMH